MKKNKSLTPEQAKAWVDAVNAWYDKYYGGVIAQDDSGSNPIPPPPPPPKNN